MKEEWLMSGAVVPVDVETTAALVAEAWSASIKNTYQHLIDEAIKAERVACAELVWPKFKVWSEDEQTAMDLAFLRAQEKHGRSETLMAVGAAVLKIKAEEIRARNNT